MTMWCGLSRGSTSWCRIRVYDPRQRRITAIDARGRQQYCDVPVMQLVLFTLALVRTVWCMPRYRRIAEPRRVLLAPQINLWQRFAD